MAKITYNKTVTEIQQDFANNCGFKSEIIWDLLSRTQDKHLRNKIKELIPDQEKGQKTIEGMRETLFTKVWAQRTYTNRNSLSAIIYVLVTKETNFKKVQKSKEFSCHPVFRTRKCIDDNDDSSQCCMIFIDEVGRVYQHWKAYLRDNVLPEGIMVAPRNGVYMLDEREEVQLEMQETPASGIAQKALNTADRTSAVAGFGAAIIPISAIFMPVAAPLIGAAALVGLTAAGYTTIRSGSALIDRRQHDQSIGLGDRQARNNWLGLAAGFVGLGASGATKAMTKVAAAGREVSAVTEVVVNGMNITSIVLSGTGVANGVLDMVLKYQDNEDISMLDIAQLSASLFLFTHSVSNFRLASKIVNDARNNTINSHRETLSNKQRRMFNKMSKETIRVRGETRGKMDIIRNVNDIPSKQYLNDLYKINKNLNQRNIRPAFGAPGEGVVLNNELPVDTGALRNNVQHNIGSDVLGRVTQPIPPSHQEPNTGNNSGSRQLQASRILFESRSNTADSSHDFIGRNPSEGVRVLSFSSIILTNEVKIALSEFGTRIFEHIINAESFEDVLTTLANNFAEDAFRFLINLADKFIHTQLKDLNTVLKMYISSESILYRMLTFCMHNYRDRSVGFLHKKETQIMMAVRDHFMSLNPKNFNGLVRKCKICSGFFSTCTL